MRGKTPKRNITPDPKFNSVVIARFINKIMERGKKSTAQNIVYEAFEIISTKSKKDPLEVFDVAIKNVAPEVEVKAKRIGGGNYQIPVPVVGNRRNALAFKWIIDGANAKKGAKMAEKLAGELMDAYNKEGSAMKKKADTYRMAEANRAFAHFARSR